MTDFSSIHYLGSRFVRELVTNPEDYPAIQIPQTKSFTRGYTARSTRLGERRLLINRVKVLEADDPYVLQGSGLKCCLSPERG